MRSIQQVRAMHKRIVAPAQYAGVGLGCAKLRDSAVKA
jgi:hypothetical protein